MRVVAAVMRHETNTFSLIETPLTSFGRFGPANAPVGGAEAIARYRGTNNPLAAYIDLVEEMGAELVVPVAGNANPSGKVADDAFDAMVASICDAVAAGCDAVLLDLHGAMVTESHDDGEGELLKRIRAIAPDVPIAVALDFHTNMSAAIAENATVVTGYCTYPHIDMAETGRRAARSLMLAIRGEAAPKIVWRALPMLTHMLKQTPAAQPMKDIMDRAMAAEASGEVMNASIFGGFPLADIPHASLSVVIVGDGDGSAASALCDELCEMAWQRREDFVFAIEPLEKSVARAKKMTAGPVVLVDHGDNTGAGGNQDIMAVLEEVLRQELDGVVAGPICDPAVVAQLVHAGIGAEVTVDLGGKIDMPALGLKGKPLRLTGRVRTITDGRFTVTGPMMTGVKISMGRTVVFDLGRVSVLVSEKRNEPFDIGIYTHAGIDPTAQNYLLIKSRQHFRAGFEPIAADIVLLAGPGVCNSDYEALPFKNLQRPIYPLDPDMTLD